MYVGGISLEKIFLKKILLSFHLGFTEELPLPRGGRDDCRVLIEKQQRGKTSNL